MAVVFTAVIGESCLHENASGMTWSFPGMCLTWNLYIMDFNLTFMSLGLGRSAKLCFVPNIASNGLWSMQSVRFLMPDYRTYCRKIQSAILFYSTLGSGHQSMNSVSG